MIVLWSILVHLLTISVHWPFIECIKCYQCGSSQDVKHALTPPYTMIHEDNCGAYDKFDKGKHIAVECNSDESNSPGTFCMKKVLQGPKGFIWDGRWRQVIRQCATVSESGVTGICNWGVEENGVYWEECYCSNDECNSAYSPKVAMKQFLFAIPTLICILFAIT